VIKKLYPDIKICLIIPDLPQYMSGESTTIYEVLKAIDFSIIKKALREIDYFVLLSDYMAEALQIEHKPWVRVEGIYDPSENADKAFQKELHKTILYSGTLDRRYGILNLLLAFKAIPQNDYRLWICGEGNCRAEVEKYAEFDKRMKYYGQKPREEVLLLQKQATVLVNPRTSEGAFTKYSFPSKTMEYMASGTPCIIHRLLGIPEDYYQYCFAAEEETAEGLKKEILHVCSKSQATLDEFGRKAADYIREYKNPRMQVRKIADMINAG